VKLSFGQFRGKADYIAVAKLKLSKALLTEYKITNDTIKQLAVYLSGLREGDHLFVKWMFFKTFKRVITFV
jgi:hypothetical protein